jgi:protein associated with RNAse G/E
MNPKVGDRLRGRAYKADGSWYRTWLATVEKVDDGTIVTSAPIGSIVEDKHRGDWASKTILRSTYWFDRPYFVIESYSAAGELLEIYVNIGTKPIIEDGELRFTDYELDVSLRPPAPARIVDEDEFAAAAEKFGYSESFKREIYQLAKDALKIAEAWQPGPAPKF